MRHLSGKTDELNVSGRLTFQEWWDVGYADGLLDQPVAPAYRPPTPEMEGWYDRGRAAGVAERERRTRLAARAVSALSREPPNPPEESA